MTRDSRPVSAVLDPPTGGSDGGVVLVGVEGELDGGPDGACESAAVGDACGLLVDTRVEGDGLVDGPVDALEDALADAPGEPLPIRARRHPGGRWPDRRVRSRQPARPAAADGEDGSECQRGHDEHRTRTAASPRVLQDPLADALRRVEHGQPHDRRGIERQLPLELAAGRTGREMCVGPGLIGDTQRLVDGIREQLANGRALGRRQGRMLHEDLRRRWGRRVTPPGEHPSSSLQGTAPAADGRQAIEAGRCVQRLRRDVRLAREDDGVDRAQPAQQPKAFDVDGPSEAASPVLRVDPDRLELAGPGHRVPPHERECGQGPVRRLDDEIVVGAVARESSSRVCFSTVIFEGAKASRCTATLASSSSGSRTGRTR